MMINYHLMINKAIIDQAIDYELSYNSRIRVKFAVLLNRVVYRMNYQCNSANISAEVHNALINGIHVSKWLNEDHIGIMRTVDMQGSQISGPQSIPVSSLSTKFVWNDNSGKWELSEEDTTKLESTIAINNYTCKRCSETRVSDTEKSCWKCGEPVVK